MLQIYVVPVVLLFLLRYVTHTIRFVTYTRSTLLRYGVGYVTFVVDTALPDLHSTLLSIPDSSTFLRRSGLRLHCYIVVGDVTITSLPSRLFLRLRYIGDSTTLRSYWRLLIPTIYTFTCRSTPRIRYSVPHHSSHVYDHHSFVDLIRLDGYPRLRVCSHVAVYVGLPRCCYYARYTCTAPVTRTVSHVTDLILVAAASTC